MSGLCFSNRCSDGSTPHQLTETVFKRWTEPCDVTPISSLSSTVCRPQLVSLYMFSTIKGYSILLYSKLYVTNEEQMKKVKKQPVFEPSLCVHVVL